MKDKLLKGVGWVALSRIFLTVTGLLSTIVVARLLSPSDFGLSAIATATLALAQSLTQLSLASALIQRESVTDGDVHTVWTLSLMRGLLLFAALTLLAPVIANSYGDQRLLAIMLVTAVTGGVSALTNPMLGLQAKELNFKTQSAFTMVQRGSIIISSIVLAFVFRSYWALIISPLVAVLFTTVWSYIIVPYVPRASLAGTRSILSFSVWLSLTQFLSMVSWRFDQLVIGLDASKADLGHYVMADNIASIPVREATQPITQVLFPGFSMISARPEKLRDTFLLAQATLFSIALPLGIGFSLIADPAIHLVLGKKWEGIIPLVQVFSIMFSISSLAVPLQSLAMATGQNKMLFKRDLQGLVVRVPLVFIGIYYGGIEGVAYSRFAAALIGTGVVLFIIRALIDVPVMRQIKANTRTIAAGAGLGLLGLLFGRLAGPVTAGDMVFRIISICAAGAFTYTIILFALWRASGRPPGPESEVWKLLERAWRSA